MLSHRFQLILIGLALISIIGFYTTVTEPVQAIAPIVIAVIMLGAYIAGAVTAWYVGNFYKTTIYESGADLGNYIKNTALTFESAFNNTNVMFNNDNTQLNAMLRYYWARKTECIGQNYINETTFPEASVLEQSGILSEYFNYTSAKADSLDNLLAMINDFTDTILPNFSTLDVIVTQNTTNTNAYSIKDDSDLGAYWYTEKTSGITSDALNYIGTYYYDNLLQSVWSKKIVIIGHEGNTASNTNVTVTFKIYNGNGTLVWSGTSGTMAHPDGSARAQTSTISLASAYTNLTHGQYYNLSYTVHNDASMTNQRVGLGIPLFFVPKNNSEILDIYVMSNEAQSFTYASVADGYRAARIQKIEWKNSTTIQETTNLNAPIANLKAIYQTTTNRIDLAIASAQSYWSYLRALGYTDITQVPHTFVIPTPAMVYIDSDVTEALDFRQLNALYFAYMTAYANTVTAETYRTVNVTASDIKLSDLSLVFNCSAYNQYGNVTYWTNTFAFLMPTTKDITFTIGANNTLNQDINAFTFTDFNATSGNFSTLKINEKVYINSAYKDGAYWNVTSTTVKVKTLGQLALSYEFTLGGDPTYTTTTSYGALLLLIPTLVLIMVVMSIFERRRR